MLGPIDELHRALTVFGHVQNDRKSMRADGFLDQKNVSGVVFNQQHIDSAVNFALHLELRSGRVSGLGSLGGQRTSSTFNIKHTPSRFISGVLQKITVGELRWHRPGLDATASD